MTPDPFIPPSVCWGYRCTSLCPAIKSIFFFASYSCSFGHLKIMASFVANDSQVEHLSHFSERIESESLWHLEERMRSDGIPGEGRGPSVHSQVQWPLQPSYIGWHFSPCPEETDRRVCKKRWKKRREGKKKRKKDDHGHHTAENPNHCLGEQSFNKLTQTGDSISLLWESNEFSYLYLGPVHGT